MVSPDLGELVRSLEGLPVAAVLIDLRTNTFVAANDRVAGVLGSPSGEVVGGDVLSYIDPRDREAARTALAAMADRVIDGYQAQRRIVTPDGKELTVSVWSRRLEGPNELYGLWILIPAGGLFPCSRDADDGCIRRRPGCN